MAIRTFDHFSSRRLRTMLLALPLTMVLVGCSMPTNGPEDQIDTSSQAPQPSGTAEAGDGSECEYVESGDPAKPGIELPPVTEVAHTGTVAYTLKLEAGDVTITMDRAKAPCTVNSFVSLAEQDYFDDTSCHRLVDSGIFVLQCGDPTGTGSGGPGYSFADETSPDDSYERGTVAMANAGADTNGSQFFLVWDDSPLPPNYTVFGQLDDKSVKVVAAIAAEGQDGSAPDGSGKPNRPATISDVVPA